MVLKIDAENEGRRVTILLAGSKVAAAREAEAPAAWSVTNGPFVTIDGTNLVESRRVAEGGQGACPLGQIVQIMVPAW